MEPRAAVNKKYKTKNSEKNYSVHAFERENGRMRTKSVCSLPATNDQEAKIKGEKRAMLLNDDIERLCRK